MPVMRDGYRLDLCASRLRFVNVMESSPIAEDSEIGFDPEPSIATLPKFVSPSNQNVGCGSVSLPLKHDNFEVFIAGMSFLEVDGTSILKYTREASSRPAHKGAEPPVHASHAVQHGQLTFPSSRSPSLDDASKTVKLISLKTCPRKTRQLEAASAFESSDASASRTCMASTGRGHHLIERKTTHSKQPVMLVEEKNRKFSLERNKIAAANCRIKRQRRETELQTHSRELSSNSAFREIVFLRTKMCR